jgi:hypothetical protein
LLPDELAEALDQKVDRLATLAEGAEDEAHHPALAVVRQRLLRRSHHALRRPILISAGAAQGTKKERALNWQ